MSIAEILDHIDYGPAPESDKEARAWLAKHAGTELFIDGGWREPESGRPGSTPSTRRPAMCSPASRRPAPADIDAAVRAAREGAAEMGGAPRP